MRLLITGGSGYVGSHCARVLSRAGHEVIIYDNLSTGFQDLARGFPLIVGDIGDRQAVNSALYKADAVLHFAAHAYVGESVEDPRKYFHNNVESAMTLLNATIDSGVRYFVFSSTCSVYGAPQRVPITEQTVPNPVNPYGVTKLLFERALEAYSRAYGLGYVALRYFNAAGADESGEIGEMHDPETHLIPLVLQVAAGERESVQIFGDDYPTPDGTCVRDYIHVNDLADAHARALEYLAGGGEPKALNLGTGVGRSVKQIIDDAENFTGRPIRREIRPRRPGDPPELVADPSLAQKVLGWKATRDTRAILSTAWNWMGKCRSIQDEVNSSKP